MSQLLEGKPLAEKIKKELIREIASYKENGVSPKAVILRIGERADDIAYEMKVLEYCDEIGMEAQVEAFSEDIGKERFHRILEEMNADDTVHGILVFRPLPEQLKEAEIGRLIRPDKDIDCMSPVNFAKIFMADLTGIVPCTPEAVIELLKYYGLELAGKNTVIVNRSMVLGRPLGMLFLGENSTVTICHSKTRNLPAILSEADIVVTGIGKAKFFGPEYFSGRSVVVDAGINFDGGKMCGDVDFQNVSSQVAAITPVPGGVGSVTSMLLLRHVLQGLKLQGF